MPKINFTQAEVDDFLKGARNHVFKEATVTLADNMAIHADGVFPFRLLKQRRPNEPLEVLLYREIIWVPITKPTFSKVFSSLQKVRRSQDWAIKYENLDEFSKIAEDESIESYCEDNFPYFTSLTNWTFSIMLRKYLIDPNAVVFTMPIDLVVQENEYLRPFPEIYSSKNVIYFREEDYAVLESPDKIIFQGTDGPAEGCSYYIVTTQNIFRYDQTTEDKGFKLVLEYQHGLGFLPVFKLGGVLIDQAQGQFLYESRIAGMLPELDEAVREYSDLQAAKVLHIYPERWEFTNNECTNCKGTGRRPNPFWTDTCNCETEIECEKCHGHGYTVAGPYSKIMVKPNDSLSSGGTIPMPPAGYIQKDIAIINTQQTGVDNHLYKALAAINFEFLAQSPAAQSGVAKAMDQDELNNTVHSIAEDIIAAMDKMYRTIAYYRYKDLYTPEEIDDMLPDTAVPQTFDLISAQHLEDELVLARKNQANPMILNALEIDYAAKRFNDPAIRDMLSLTLSLDPLPNQLETDKVLMLQNQGITEQTYIVSANIEEFIADAMDADPDFVEKDRAEQKAVIYKMAQAQMDAVNTAKALVRSAFMSNNGNGVNNPAAGGTEPDPNNPTNGTNVLQPDYSGNNGFNNGLQQTNPGFTAGNVV